MWYSLKPMEYNKKNCLLYNSAGKQRLFKMSDPWINTLGSKMAASHASGHVWKCLWCTQSTTSIYCTLPTMRLTQILDVKSCGLFHICLFCCLNTWQTIPIQLFNTLQTQFMRARKQFCSGEKQENSCNQPFVCDLEEWRDSIRAVFVAHMLLVIRSVLGWIDVLLKLLYVALKSWYGLNEAK